MLVALEYIVCRELPFQYTVEDATKLDPVRVSTNAAAPAVAVVGDRDLRTGKGFCGDLEPPPPHPTRSVINPTTTTSVATCRPIPISPARRATITAHNQRHAHQEFP